MASDKLIRPRTRKGTKKKTNSHRHGNGNDQPAVAYARRAAQAEGHKHRGDQPAQQKRPRFAAIAQRPLRPKGSAIRK